MDDPEFDKELEWARHEVRCVMAFQELARHLGCDPSDLNIDLVKWYEAFFSADRLITVMLDHDGEFIVTDWDRLRRQIRKALAQLPKKQKP